MHLKRSAAVGLCALSLALCVPSRAVIQNGTLLHFEAMNNASFATCQGSRAEFCVRTCCEKGENVISRKCAPSSTDWAPTFLNQTTTANLEIIGGFIQECKFGYQLKTLSFHIDESTKYLLSSSGELEVQTAENTFALGFNYCFFNLEVNDQILESVRSCVKISVPQVAGLPSIDSVPSVSVRKCCPPDQMMGVSKDALVCVNRSSPWRPAVIHSYPTQLAQLPAEKTNISDPGKFKCPNGTSMQFLIPSASKDAFFLMSNGNILLARYNLSIKPGLFCLDDLRNPTSAPQPFATVCHTMPKQRTPKQLEAHCTDEVCVQKCCAAGFRLHNSQCVPTTLRWKPTFYEGERLFRGQVAHKVLYGQINCDDGEIHVFNGSRSATPLLQKNGGLRVNGTVYTFGVHRCCIDSGSIQNLPASLNSPGHTLAFCCQPHDKEAELMEIVKKILLIMSSICLFVMLAIYMLVPCLRNIHGKCLMSHAAALFAAFFFTVYNQIVPVEEGPSCDALGENNATVLYYFHSCIEVISSNADG
ncbi:uncharacterized protein LOC119100788 [Pollicipes pollicipes]|uniref:uncharacterized protein LOC119100788 n=1 Tax=Pollicipes pollicipes TaxID=41117 RepID=UPI001884BE88|nr:uncharacterized protein LOC119100788 [Pollicipes pollicipes]